MIIFCFDSDKNTESIFKNLIKESSVDIRDFHFNENPNQISFDSPSSGYLFFIDTRTFIKKQNGFAFAAKLRKRFPDCHIVFMSLYPEDVLFSFKNLVRPSGFMLKPIVQQEVLSFINTVETYERNIDKEKTILISTREIKRNLHISKIAYFSTRGKKLYCRVSNGEQLEFYGTLSKLEEEYQEDFIRCHSGFLVNRSYIKGVKKGELELLNCNETIPVSKKYKKQVID